jgi:hypothetical protein
LTILLPLILAASAQCFTASPDLLASLNQAQATTHCMTIPEGNYTLTDTLNLTADDFTLSGAGMGKTTITTIGKPLAGDLNIIGLSGARQSVSDLSIAVGSGYSGLGAVGAIAIHPSAIYATIERVEVSGGFGGNVSNGYGIGTYRPWNDDNGDQHATIAECHIHDSPTTAIGINSNRNTIRDNRIERVGDNEYRHGIYAQGGYNLYQGNTVIDASGYSFHGWKHVPNLDASGDLWIDNTSINPHSGHIVVSGIPNEINPAFPVGTPLTRNVFVLHNTFIGHPPISWWIDAEVIASGNTFQ